MNASKKTGREIPAQRKVEIKPSGNARQFEAGGRSVTFVPLSIKRRSYRKLLVPPPGASSPKIKTSFDLPMIRTLGKAFYWQRLIESGEVANALEIARQLKMEPGWVAEILRLTRLAPDIVQAIVEGRQPRTLNLQTIRGRQGEVPLNWEEQRVLFGFASDVAFEQ